MVERVDDWQTITRKTGDESKKRSLVIRDGSGRSVEITLWGNYVDEPGLMLQNVGGADVAVLLTWQCYRCGSSTAGFWLWGLGRDVSFIPTDNLLRSRCGASGG